MPVPKNKLVLSAQVDKSVIPLLKEICIRERRSQAKTLEILIEQKAKELGIIP